MTMQEIIESINYCLECDNDSIPTTQDDLQTIKEALEKQIPKKPIEKEVIGVSMSGYKYKGQCPKCSLTVSQFLGNYCHHCGQALDWSEYND